MIEDWLYENVAHKNHFILSNSIFFENLAKDFLEDILLKIKLGIKAKQRKLQNLIKNNRNIREKISHINVIDSVLAYYLVMDCLDQGIEPRIIVSRLKDLEKEIDNIYEKVGVWLYIKQMMNLRYKAYILYRKTKPLHPSELNLAELENNLRGSFGYNQTPAGIRQAIYKYPKEIVLWIQYIVNSLEYHCIRHYDDDNYSESRNLLKDDLLKFINNKYYKGILQDKNLLIFLRELIKDEVEQFFKNKIFSNYFAFLDFYKFIWEPQNQRKRKIAIHSLQKVTKTSKDAIILSQAYNCLGYIYTFDKNDFRFVKSISSKKAIVYYERAFSFTYSLPADSYLSLGTLYLMSDLPIKASDIFRKLLIQYPRFASRYIYLNLNQNFFEKGFKNKCQLKKELRMQTLDAESHYILLLANIINERYDRAKEHYQTATALGYDTSYLKEMLNIETKQ